MIASFLLAMEVALQFEVNIPASENIYHAIEHFSALVHPAASKRFSQRPVFIAGKADETCGMILKFVFEHCAFIFLGTQLHPSEQAAQILITSAGCDQ